MTHPALRELLQSLARNDTFQQVARQLTAARTGPHSLAGLTPAARAIYLVLLWQIVERPLIVVTDGSKSAETLHELLETFFDILVFRADTPRPLLLPALDVLPHQNLSPHAAISEQRAIGLHRLARNAAPVAVTPIASALLRLAPPDRYRQLSVRLEPGDEIPMDELIAHLRGIGYEKREPVEMVGEFSVRGGILDVFPAEAERPVRIEFFGDEVESLRAFDVETQRSVLKLAGTTLLPLTETPRTPAVLRAIGQDEGEPGPGWEFAAAAAEQRDATILDMSREAIVVIDEPDQVRSAAARLWKRLEDGADGSVVAPQSIFCTFDDWLERAARHATLELRHLDLDGGARIATRPGVAFHGNMQIVVAEARSLVEQGTRVVFFAASLGEMERIADIFGEYSLPFQLAIDRSDPAVAHLHQRPYAGDSAGIVLARGAVRHGTLFPESGVGIIGSEDLFERTATAPQAAVRASQMGAFAADIGDLKPGDYIVHAQHGIAQFLGIRELSQGDSTGDFMLLEYSGGAKLYVPLARMDLVQKYRGGGEAAPGLDKLGGATWAKTKSRVKAKMRDMAEELLRLYSERRLAEGFAFSPDSGWQREFEDAFEYTATADQDSAVADIKRDMERPHPMDRLLCGDVGFGKTEVAMRAAFKALGDGKQVAVLTPTTVLCFQHYESFKRRFAAFPIRVEMFSRFRTAKELKALVDELAEGKIDVAIGTHRLLSADVQFRDLGLMIVDEEQRFGVRAKERLKQMRKNVDVLTMSATPIPRTLHMSLLGVRDLSVIETPPKDRLAIHTMVAKFDPGIIKTAIEQELARGGQVYYVHNRVDSIWNRASFIQELVPEARIGVGHGQMDEAALEKVILGFMRHEFDVFVCTTIIENGIDIPLANTMIVEHAERHGLSELYQLRGRVGRSNRRAYAYLLVPEDAELTDIARKRLAALREFSDLGAGFKIAALDLELRGAGNLLGGEQHGHINAVGYDMYMSLLEQSVKELRGEQIRPEIRTSLNLGLDIRIPATYIAEEHQRLRAYKQIAEVKNHEEADAILSGLEDRYGPAPAAIGLLLQFARVKSAAESIGVEAIDRKQGAIRLKFHTEAQLDPAGLMNLVQSTKGAQFTPDGVLSIPLAPGSDAATVLNRLTPILDAITAPVDRPS